MSIYGPDAPSLNECNADAAADAAAALERDHRRTCVCDGRIVEQVQPDPDEAPLYLVAVFTCGDQAHSDDLGLTWDDDPTREKAVY